MRHVAHSSAGRGTAHHVVAVLSGLLLVRLDGLLATAASAIAATSAVVAVAASAAARARYCWHYWHDCYHGCRYYYYTLGTGC